VVLAEHLGDAAVLHLRLPGIEGLLQAKLAAEGVMPAAGEAVGLSADPAKVLAFDASGRRIDG
jgi:multiple sugar transport system ATP-binding protein